MTGRPDTSSASSPPAWRRDPARLWHGAWLSLYVGAAFVSLAFPGGLWLGLAMLFAAAPGLAGLLPMRRQSLLILIWAAGGAGAALMAGGLGGPLIGLCLSPLAAASVLDRRTPLAGAASLAGLGGVALLDMAGVMAPAAPGALQVLAIGSLAVGLGAGVALGQARERHRAGAVGRLEMVLRANPGLLLIVNEAGRVGDAYGRYLPGLPISALRSEGLLALAAETDRTALAKTLQAAASETASLRFTPLAAPKATLELTVRRMGSGHIAAALRDASGDRLREDAAEQARRRAEAEASGRSRFLAAMSHELRTPLNAIIGFSDIMRQRLFGPLSDRYGEYAQLIHESGQHLLDLIGDVLDISKIDADRYELSLETFDGREAVQAALRLLRPQADNAKITLRGELGERELEIQADRRALKQIVLNLVANALKFTPAGGSITVTTAIEGGDFQLTVSDTGVGIAAADLDRLGKPYEQAGDAESRAKGTGLGLSLVRAFARLHGGEMTAESDLGQGATFTVRMPVAQAQPELPIIEPGGNVVLFNPR